MKFDDSPVTINRMHNRIAAFDPGAKDIGLVVVDSYDYNPELEGFRDVVFTTLELEKILEKGVNDCCSLVQVFEAPFFKTNPSTLGHTWLSIGAVWNPYAYHVFVTPQMGNKILGLEKASTVDVAKMNVAKELGWEFKTQHEVSAYAALLAAIKEGKLIIE